MGEPSLEGTQAFLAQAFRKVGENVPASKEASNPMRTLLLSAGYRYPSAVPIFYGIKCAWDAVGLRGWGRSARWHGAPAFSVLIARRVRRRLRFPRARFDPQAPHPSPRRRIHRAIPASLDLLTLSVEAGQSLESGHRRNERGTARGSPRLQRGVGAGPSRAARRQEPRRGAAAPGRPEQAIRS